MKQKSWILIFTVLAAVLAAVTALQTKRGGTLAAVYQDGRQIAVLDLRHDTELTVTGPAGKNIVAVSDGKVSVRQADCPDQICVKHGPLTENGGPIVCLPNRLSVQWLSKQTAVDAVSGGGG